MSDAARWTIGAMVAVLILALIIWARGDVHRRGDDIGSSAITWTLADS